MTSRGKKNTLYTSSTWTHAILFPENDAAGTIYLGARKQEGGPQMASSRTYLPLLQAWHALAWSSSIDHGSSVDAMMLARPPA